MASEWYYVKNGQQQGPHSTEQLRQLASAGEIGPDDLVWKEGMPEWTPASRLQDLSFPNVAPATESAKPYSPAAVAASAPEAVLPYYDGTGGIAIAATERALDLFRQTRPWARLVSVILFIVAGLLVFGSLALVVVLIASGDSDSIFLAPVVLIYVAFGALLIAPALYLGRYASRITSMVASRSPRDLEAALQAQKSVWKFVGILAIVIVGIYLIIIPLVVVGRL